MIKSLIKKALDKHTKSSRFRFSFLVSRFSFLAISVFLIATSASAQIKIKEKVEINPQNLIAPDAPLSNHTIRVDMQWSPVSLPGWIMFYDLQCDTNDYSSAHSTTGTNSYSLTSLGYENYQIQLRFGSLDPNQPTITGAYQLYYDEQLIQTANFQAQPASYSNFAYFNIHYLSPVLTDYTFSIYTTELCPGSYEDINITTSSNCNAVAEINTEQDSITLTIEDGREFVSLFKNNQKADTLKFMYNELGSVKLRLDSINTGTSPINVSIKSNWAGMIKNQQLVINPQEQYQIRVPDQPIIVSSGSAVGVKIEPYNRGICLPYISENIRYTALIKKGSSRGLLYDYDTGQSGDTLTSLTPQEDGEKYLDFITEGEILNEEDTVIIKIFANDVNIDTTEAVIIIYPNDLVVQIIPPVISQGDTARVVLKKRGVNGLEEFAPDKLFNVEIVQGLEYGLILDSLSNDTLTSFSEIPQGFKIIAKDSTAMDSTKIRIKVTTEEIGFPVARIIQNNTKQNKKEIVDENENKKSDDEIITPDWIIPGPILLEGFGDVVVKQDEWCEELDECDEIEFPDIELEVYENNWQNLNVCQDPTFLAGTAFLTSDNSNYIEDFDIELCKEEGTDKIQFTFDDDIVINCVSDMCETNISAGQDILINDVYSFPNGTSCGDKIFWLELHKIYPMPTANIFIGPGVIIQSVYVIRAIWERHEEEHREHFLHVAEGFKAEYLKKIKDEKKKCSDFDSEENAMKFFKERAENIIKDFYNAVKNEDDRISSGGDDGGDILKFEKDKIHKKVIDDYLQPLIDRWKLTNCVD